MLVPEAGKCVSFDQGELRDINMLDKNGEIVGFNITYTQSEELRSQTDPCKNGQRQEDYRMNIITYCNQRYDNLVEIVSEETGFGPPDYLCHPQFVYYSKSACPVYQQSRFLGMFHENI